MTDKPMFRLVFTPAGNHDPRPPAIRLRLLLKFALRSLSLRCTEAVELPAQTPQPDVKEGTT